MSDQVALAIIGAGQTVLLALIAAIFIKDHAKNNHEGQGR